MVPNRDQDDVEQRLVVHAAASSDSRQCVDFCKTSCTIFEDETETRSPFVLSLDKKKSIHGNKNNDDGIRNDFNVFGRLGQPSAVVSAQRRMHTGTEA